eukprot:PhF_6_TR6036/c0_g1_i1/m.8717
MSTTIKLVVLGDTGVGKSCLITRYAEGIFLENPFSTIGMQFKNKAVSVDGVAVPVQLFDFAGQERFQKTINIGDFLRQAHGVVFVFDLSRGETFLKVFEWMERVRLMLPKGCVAFIVGNKSDAPRGIELDRGKRFAEENGLLYWETSARSGANVEEAFNGMVSVLYKKLKVSSGLTSPLSPISPQQQQQQQQPQQPQLLTPTHHSVAPTPRHNTPARSQPRATHFTETQLLLPSPVMPFYPTESLISGYVVLSGPSYVKYSAYNNQPDVIGRLAAAARDDIAVAAGMPPQLSATECWAKVSPGRIKGIQLLHPSIKDLEQLKEPQPPVMLNCELGFKVEFAIRCGHRVRSELILRMHQVLGDNYNVALKKFYNLIAEYEAFFDQGFNPANCVVEEVYVVDGPYGFEKNIEGVSPPRGRIITNDVTSVRRDVYMGSQQQLRADFMDATPHAAVHNQQYYYHDSPPREPFVATRSPAIVTQQQPPQPTHEKRYYVDEVDPNAFMRKVGPYLYDPQRSQPYAYFEDDSPPRTGLGHSIDAVYHHPSVTRPQSGGSRIVYATDIPPTSSPHYGVRRSPFR